MMNDVQPPSGQSAAPADAIAEAIDILTQSADDLRECHTLSTAPDDWSGELEAKAEYDRILRCVAALRCQPAAATVPADERGTPDIAEFGELIDDYQCAQKDGSEDQRARARIALMAAYRAALAAPAAPHLNVTLEQATLALERAGMTESMRIVRGIKIPNDGRITAQAAPQAGEDARPVAPHLSDIEHPEQHARADSPESDGETFAAWLAREIPPGTVISNPAWWAPRILRAALRATPQPAAQAAPAVSEDTPEAIEGTIQVLKECGGFTEQAPVIRQLRRYATLLDALTTQGARHE